MARRSIDVGTLALWETINPAPINKILIRRHLVAEVLGCTRFLGCCNKVQQTRWLAAQFWRRTESEVTVSVGWFLLEALWRLHSTSPSWLVDASLRSPPPSLQGLPLWICVSLLYSNKDWVAGFLRPFLQPGCSHLETINLISSSLILFPHKATITVTGLGLEQYLFGRPCSIPICQCFVMADDQFVK